MDASFGVDECAGWMGTEADVELEAGFGAGPGSGQTVTEVFGERPVADCGFGMGVAVAAAGVSHAWSGRAGVLGIEAGLGADWETESEDAAGDGVGAGAGAGGVAEGEDAEVQTGTES